MKGMTPGSYVWSRVYVAAIKRLPHAEACSMADKAKAEFDARFDRQARLETKEDDRRG
jgi:hypothetical protein